jgi:hypothetical protein
MIGFKEIGFFHHTGCRRGQQPESLWAFPPPNTGHNSAGAGLAHWYRARPAAPRVKVKGWPYFGHPRLLTGKEVAA